MRLALVLALGLVASSVRADELEVNPWVSGGIAVGGAIVWPILNRIDALRPDSCRLICEDSVNGLDTGVRDAVVWDDKTLASDISNVTAYGVAPLVGLVGVGLAAVYDGRGDEWFDDALIVAESTAAVVVLNKIAVLSFGRERPRTRELLPGEPVPSDAYQSFYSGHTSLAFGLTMSAATVAQLRGYRLAPWFWVAAGLVGGTTAYMRIAGNHHWFTDVTTGMVVSTAVAVGIPFLHRRKHAVDVSLAPMPGGGQLVLAGTW